MHRAAVGGPAARPRTRARRGNREAALGGPGCHAGGRSGRALGAALRVAVRVRSAWSIASPPSSAHRSSAVRAGTVIRRPCRSWTSSGGTRRRSKRKPGREIAAVLTAHHTSSPGSVQPEAQLRSGPLDEHRVGVASRGQDADLPVERPGLGRVDARAGRKPAPLIGADGRSHRASSGCSARTRRPSRRTISRTSSCSVRTEPSGQAGVVRAVVRRAARRRVLGRVVRSCSAAEERRPRERVDVAAEDLTLERGTVQPREHRPPEPPRRGDVPRRGARVRLALGDRDRAPLGQQADGRARAPRPTRSRAGRAGGPPPRAGPRGAPPRPTPGSAPGTCRRGTAAVSTFAVHSATSASMFRVRRSCDLTGAPGLGRRALEVPADEVGAGPRLVGEEVVHRPPRGRRARPRRSGRLRARSPPS